MLELNDPTLLHVRAVSEVSTQGVTTMLAIPAEATARSMQLAHARTAPAETAARSITEGTPHAPGVGGMSAVRHTAKACTLCRPSTQRAQRAQRAHLRPEGALGEQHAGEEGAELLAEAGLVGRDGRAADGEQARGDKRVVRAR